PLYTSAVPPQKHGVKIARRASWLGRYLPTNVVTVVPPSTAVKAPPLTVIAVLAARLSVDEVTHGVIEVGAVPPETTIGMLTAVAFLLMATMTTVPSVPPAL